MPNKIKQFFQITFRCHPDPGFGYILVCLYVYVCVYVYVYVCVYIYVYGSVYVCVYDCVYIVSMYDCVYIVSMSMSIMVSMSMSMSVSMYVSINVPMSQSMYVNQGVQKFGQTKLQFAVGRDCKQKHFSKYEIEKNAFLGLGSVI